MRCRFVAMCALVVMAVVLHPRLASAGDGETVIRDAETRFRALLAETPEPTAKIETHLRTLFDIDQVARAALERHWSSLTSKQRDELVELLRALIERRYIASMRSAFAHSIEYKGEVAEGDTVRVRTVIIDTDKRGRTSKVSVDYIVRKGESGYRVEDMVTDSVSMVENYRSQFNRVIKKRGVDGLIEKLRAKRDATQ